MFLESTILFFLTRQKSMLKSLKSLGVESELPEDQLK